MKIRIPSSIVMMGLIMSAANVHAGEILLQRGDIQVNARDVEQYIRERVPPEARGAILAKPDSLRDIASSIYIIRALGAEAEAAKELDHEQISWQAENQRQRLLMNALLSHMVQVRLADHDWDAAAREVYIAERDRFKIEEQVRASHILVKTEGRGEEEALALVKSLRERALKGEDFMELAKAHSEDPSAQKNAGDLGFFRRGQMVAPFEEVAFAMKEAGAISDPVQTQFGYHLIRFQERQEARQRGFDEVKDDIIKDLRQKIANHTRQTEITRVRSAPDLEWNEELLKALPERLGERLE